ncbi:Transcriptional regulatory protein, C terminal [Serratia fonticola]|jgi:DNA-binding winged helix-turn-helix (wHTH) protein|uniref:Helix-turn-helix domain-containing protein n=1 Tax=Serratia fonticola TaxID=47917 RepID=A0AAE7EKA8_SERFO|nr:helix-turn-helix domain-containing protein [Serratia fonticola]QKJ60441.1 helix-turn-helix domain-containing protein [Serratia fonticola]CAI1717022.1 Transcriptional regulatory protein, C terminal [Serratia fonticola]
MENRLYGFLIDDDIQFDIANRRLLYYSDGASERTLFFKVISLNEIQTRLLIYLLANCRDAVIYKNDIMKNVWEEINLSSSSQRLWHAINELRKKLASLGLPEDFIANVHGIGYSVDNHRVSSLFIK